MFPILIGSRAIKYYFPDFRNTDKSDYDFLCLKEQIKILFPDASIHKEWHYKDSSLHQEIETVESFDDYNHKYCVATPETLMMLKRSHLYWPHNWYKHIEDYHFLKNKGIKVDQEKLARRIKLTEERLGKPNTPNLNVSKEEFFGRSAQRVDYYFDHDDIHKIMAHQEKPIYTYMLKDNAPIYCDRNKFEALPYEWQLQAVMEEAYVIAIERKILPMLWSGAPFTTALDAYKWAIMRICTNLTSGWFRDFAIENYPEFIKRYDSHYVIKFLTAYDNKQIRRMK